MTTTVRSDSLPTMWHVPPVCQGQIVEVAYGVGEDAIAYRRVTDRSDRSVRHEMADEEPDTSWNPWNSEPGGYTWRTVEVS